MGCQKKVVKKEYPVIYDAWTARYKYDPLTRKMNAVSHDQPVGLSWSRDESGRLDFMYYYSGGLGRDENLLIDHKIKLDQRRDKQWEESRGSRIKQVEEALARIDNNSSKKGIENIVEEKSDSSAEFDLFLPSSSIPSNIEISPLNEGDGNDFTPLPTTESEIMNDIQSEQGNSPFAPLPAIE